ncbi:hypothetical protein C8Q77DRAFT_1061854 [Trametes polyzona]|nr:hypothetical protein C8Q77DRAFT_1061854 [Trametes polyzona]
MLSWSVALYCLLGLTAFNSLFVGYVVHTLKGVIPQPVVYSYIGDDHPTHLPIHLALVGLVLEPGAPHFPLESDAEWGSIFPKDDGFTPLGPANRTFHVAMVHQMHCLDVFRVGYATCEPEYKHHIEHCLRYLRQTLLCLADTTLEESVPSRNKHGKLVHSSAGYGIVHRCRDWTALRRYLDDHPPVPLEDDDSSV